MLERNNRYNIRIIQIEIQKGEIMPTWFVHALWLVPIVLGFLIGTFGIDIDHYQNECNVIEQTCVDTRRTTLFLHNWFFPMFFIVLGLSWALHMFLDSQVIR